MALAAQACVERGAQIIDINMGCPAKNVCKKLAGSALLQNETLVAQILDAVIAAVDVPVTLKMRTGWDREHRNGVQIAKIAEQSGVQSLAVHGRTRACKYKGEAEYDTIAQIKQAVAIPVFANGDITTLDKSLEVLRLTGADGLMIGRGAQGRPWIFRQLAAFHAGEKKIEPLEKNELRDTMLGHLEELHRFYGESVGVRVARKHLTWYSRQLVNADEFRYQAVRAESGQKQIRLVQDFFDRADGGISVAA
jgi:tRNA-dihydrouridine synthase B